MRFPNWNHVIPLENPKDQISVRTSGGPELPRTSRTPEAAAPELQLPPDLLQSGACASLLSSGRSSAGLTGHVLHSWSWTPGSGLPDLDSWSCTPGPGLSVLDSRFGSFRAEQQVMQRLLTCRSKAVWRFTVGARTGGPATEWCLHEPSEVPELLPSKVPSSLLTD